jgi:hypothetical protein
MPEKGIRNNEKEEDLICKIYILKQYEKCRSQLRHHLERANSGVWSSYPTDGVG